MGKNAFLIGADESNLAEHPKSAHHNKGSQEPWTTRGSFLACFLLSALLLLPGCAGLDKEVSQTPGNGDAKGHPTRLNGGDVTNEKPGDNQDQSNMN